MTDRGVIYLIAGTKHNVMGAVSIRSLRRVWDGPVAIFANADSMRTVKRIAKAAGCQVIHHELKRYRRNTCYAGKPALPALSPYKHTVQLDADTLVMRPFDELWPRHDREFVLSMFSSWTTHQPLIRKRVSTWAEGVAEDELRESLAQPYPALNTGILAYGNECIEAREQWAEITARKPDVFMSDELAAQVQLPVWNDAGNTRVLHDAFNWSPLYHSRPLAEARIVHFHGQKCLHPAAFDIWWPEYQAAIDENWARIRRWTPAGDKRLKAYLAGNDPYKDKRS
jgi:hypothetical protein